MSKDKQKIVFLTISLVVLIGVMIFLAWVSLTVMAPLSETSGETNSSAHLSCLERPNLPSGYERTDFQNLTDKQQSLVMESRQEGEFSDLNRSQAGFFESHNAIKTNETIYYCTVAYP